MFVLILIKESEKTREPTEPSGKTSEPSGKGPTAGARNGGDEGGSNAMTVSLIVVGCLVLLVAGVLLVIWSRRRSAKAEKEKNGGSHKLLIYNSSGLGERATQNK